MLQSYKYKQSLFLLISSMYLSTAMGMESADIAVAGTIAPAACDPTFAADGKVDYGHIPASTLSRNTPTVLGFKSMAYAVVCDSPAMVALSWSDARPDSAFSEGGLTPYRYFGLGKQGEANIGSYLLRMTDSALGDGDVIDVIQRNDGDGPAWAHPVNGVSHGQGQKFAFSSIGETVPHPYRTVSGTFSVRARIVPASTLDLTHSAYLDGLSVMTINYL